MIVFYQQCYTLAVVVILTHKSENVRFKNGKQLTLGHTSGRMPTSNSGPVILAKQQSTRAQKMSLLCRTVQRTAGPESNRMFLSDTDFFIFQ